MTTFHFKAVAADGKPRAGTLTGENEKSVARELARQGLTPIYVGVEQKSGGLSFELPKFGGGKKKDILFFTQEIATLLNSGIPLDRALGITIELTEKKQFRDLLGEVLRTLKGGKSFADSLASHPEYFSELYINMVRAGEASGSLTVVFERLAEFEKTRDELRGYITSAMVYPALLSFVGAGSIFILMYFVVPKFAQIFEDSRMPMPTPTRILVETSYVIRSYGLLVIAALVAAFFGFRAYIRTLDGKLWWDTIRLKIPLLGVALRKAETARFARAMGTLVANTVPLVQSLGIAEKILNNKRMSGTLQAVSQGVKRGEGLAGPLRKTGEFPPLAAHLLTVGEETGKLDVMFHRMADIYETETREAIKRFTAFFEPAIILIMGVLLGTLILSMLMAISSLNEVAM
ncbi:type II secretion system protein F [Bryobacterales bacterium F-183]|nr:type II secretion system protein F [Bryobacterales bacterium F-183]